MCSHAPCLRSCLQMVSGLMAAHAQSLRALSLTHSQLLTDGEAPHMLTVLVLQLSEWVCMALFSLHNSLSTSHDLLALWVAGS